MFKALAWRPVADRSHVTLLDAGSCPVALRVGTGWTQVGKVIDAGAVARASGASTLRPLEKVVPPPDRCSLARRERSREFCRRG